MTQHQTTFGDKCERNPTKVMEYLGFKSTSDPLFKAESTMMRLKASVPPDRESEFYDAIDAFSQNAEEANSMAFVSSWGESNPGGGKDRVRLFIERSRNNVVKSRDSLRTVMDILDLEPWIGERSALGRTWWRARRIVALFLDVAYLYIISLEWIRWQENALLAGTKMSFSWWTNAQS